MKRFVAALFAALPLLAQAHVGTHAHDDFSLLQAFAHLLTDADHLVLLLVAAAAGIAGTLIYRRRRALRRDR